MPFFVDLKNVVVGSTFLNFLKRGRTERRVENRMAYGGRGNKDPCLGKFKKVCSGTEEGATTKEEKERKKIGKN